MRTRIGVLLAVLGLAAIAAGTGTAQDDAPPTIEIQPVPTGTPTMLPTPMPEATTDAEGIEATAEGTAEATSEAVEATPTATIDATPTLAQTLVVLPPNPQRGQATFESTFIRAAPSFDSEPIASVFIDDYLEVVGRNLDSTWYEVQRPNRMNSIGWINRESMTDIADPESVPVTDFTTGLTGDAPVDPANPGVGVWIVEGVALRTLPDRLQGERILNIPPSVVAQAFERFDGQAWLRVNYLGNEGWIIGFTTRERPEVAALPENTTILAIPASVNVEVIPPEVQRAQVQRLREFTQYHLGISDDLAGFWFMVQNGDVMPCDPPASVLEYAYSGRDVRELPETDRLAPRVNDGIDYLNASIGTLQQCGIIDPSDVVRARNNAINARVIFEATLPVLDDVERLIRP